MKVTAAALKQAILDNDDFGHEMRTRYAIYEASAKEGKDPYAQIYIENPIHGSTYVDPSLNKAREFDFRCTIKNEEDKSDRRFVHLAIECKNLHHEKPLVISGRERESREAYFVVIESIYDFRRVHAFSTRVVRNRHDLYPASAFVGKTWGRPLSAKGENKQPDVYDRWNQAVQSGTEMAQAAGGLSRPQSVARSIVLPFVVVPDGLLWKTLYDSKGFPQDPVQCDHCEYFIGRKVSLPPIASVDPPREFDFSHLHFATLTGLRDFLINLKNSPGFWLDIFSQ